jgi:hypothetical protein
MRASTWTEARLFKYRRSLKSRFDSKRAKLVKHVDL